MEYENDRGWVRPYLEDGETMLWAGKPARLHLLNKGDFFMIPFSLVWSGLFFSAISRTPRNATIHGGMAFPFYIVPAIIIVVALYMLFGRFIVRAVQIKRSSYAVTTGKILLRRGNRVDMLLKKSLPPFSVQRHRDGTGTITFRQVGMYRRDSIGSRSNGNTIIYFSLEGLEDVDRVLKAIQTTDPGRVQY